MAKQIVTNTAIGPRGFIANGSEILLDPGRTWEGEMTDAELANAKDAGHFAYGDAGRKAAAKAAEPAVDPEVAKLREENARLLAELEAAKTPKK